MLHALVWNRWTFRRSWTRCFGLYSSISREELLKNSTAETRHPSTSRSLSSFEQQQAQQALTFPGHVDLKNLRKARREDTMARLGSLPFFRLVYVATEHPQRIVPSKRVQSGIVPSVALFERASLVKGEFSPRVTYILAATYPGDCTCCHGK